MRSLAALLSLTLQLRPLFGVALCLGLGRADVSRMEPGCPMDEPPQSQVEVTVAHGRSDTAALTSADLSTASHSCALADACTVVSNAIIPAPSAALAMEVSRGEMRRSTDPVPDLARFAPPTPPPNS